jgi:hypothetical protein
MARRARLPTMFLMSLVTERKDSQVSLSPLILSF